MVSTNLRDWLLASADRHADRPALWVHERLISYRELIAHANYLASILVHVKPRRIAVLADRHLACYVGILGTVLAGHAYVPLNPHHPLDRLKSILRRADVGALVIDQAAFEAHSELIKAAPRVVVVPDGAPTGAQEPLDVTVEPDDGAYLLFTSGSTGEPKGVMVNQRNVMTYLGNVCQRYDLGAGDRMTQLFDLTFDLSVHDLFVTWGVGATLYCPSEGNRKAPYKFLRDHALTHWFSAPSTAAFMDRLHMLRPGLFPDLRLSLFCGEALPTTLARKWQAAAPRSIIDNLYGPTEATIAFTAFRLPDDLTGFPDIVPIGHPLPDQQVQITDEQELLLSGSQVTKGYWQRPDLTAERFVDGWYHTGDRVQVGRHGLEYLGRLDWQVKILGNRVELLEVESVLREAAVCPTVAAIAWPVRDGMAQGLVAFVPEEAEVSDTMILGHIRSRLPPYMLPARIIRVADWPLNSNGKTDYSGLSAILADGV
jgi:D-alanine--poly(phosphoribitol) ligase subunit 1